MPLDRQPITYLTTVQGFDNSLITKTVAAADDFAVMIDNTGTPYKITKANLLTGLSSGSGSGSGSGTAGDIYFNSVKLLLKGIGANNSTDIIDSSITNRVPVKIGNPIISTLKSKFDSSSIYFDGSSALNYQSSDFNFAGDFTIDFWVSLNDVNKGNVLIEMRPDGNNGNYPMISLGDGGIFALYQDSGTRYQSPPTFVSNTFYYIGLKRVAGETQLWCNGTLRGAYNSGVYSTPSRILIGALAFRNFAPNTYLSGYLSGFRVTNANRDLSIIPTASFQAS